MIRRRRAVRRGGRRLGLRYDPEALGLVRGRLADAARRASALEVLDTLLEPSLRPLVMPFVDEVPETERIARARAMTGPPPAPEAFLREQCRHANPYVVLLALNALRQHAPRAAAEEARRLGNDPDPLVREGAVLAACGSPPEGQMYTTLERILLLKRAAIFQRVSGEDLAPLARVAQVEVHAPGARIVQEGEMGDALFVIVRGRVRVERGGQPVAELGPGETFGEMAILDGAPRSASVLALDETELLWIGSEAFYEILHEQVEIAEGVIRMLSARLRDANTALGQRPTGEIPVRQAAPAP